MPLPPYPVNRFEMGITRQSAVAKPGFLTGSLRVTQIWISVPVLMGVAFLGACESSQQGV